MGLINLVDQTHNPLRDDGFRRFTEKGARCFKSYLVKWNKSAGGATESTRTNSQ